MLLGAHESVSGGFSKAIERGAEDGCSCIQIFTHSPRMWNVKPLGKEEIELFRKKTVELSINPNVSHASYLLNIANEDSAARSRAVNSLIVELGRAEMFGLYGVVLHPGFSKAGDACEKIADSINKAFNKTKSIKLFIETMAGQGSSVGSRFEELKKILDNVSDKKRIGICFDTCHAYSAGYDIAKKQNEVFEEFDRIIGLDYLKCFHLNDSMNELNSRKDRHENIGKGRIGLAAFGELVNDKRFENTPGYLETPSDYAMNIEVLKRLIKGK